MPESPHLKKPIQYTARVEYRAVQAEVERMLERGHSARAIFEEMSRSGKLTISYSTFCAYVRGGGRRPRKGARHAQRPAPGLTPRSSTRPWGGPAAGRREALPGPFVHDKDIDISELV